VRPRAAHGGFTLIELLVVIAIVAIAAAGVGFALRTPAGAALDREAERLAALLESARAQSRASGAAVRWRLTDEGFAFDGLPVGTLPTHWLAAGVQARPQSADGVPLAVLLLGPEPIVPAQQVLLATEADPARALRVGTDGLRPFSVSTP